MSGSSYVVLLKIAEENVENFFLEYSLRDPIIEIKKVQIGQFNIQVALSYHQQGRVIKWLRKLRLNFPIENSEYFTDVQLEEVQKSFTMTPQLTTNENTGQVVVVAIQIPGGNKIGAWELTNKIASIEYVRVLNYFVITNETERKK